MSPSIWALSMVDCVTVMPPVSGSATRVKDRISSRVARLSRPRKRDNSRAFRATNRPAVLAAAAKSPSAPPPPGPAATTKARPQELSEPISPPHWSSMNRSQSPPAFSPSKSAMLPEPLAPTV
jgi:hypothetical protein